METRVLSGVNVYSQVETRVLSGRGTCSQVETRVQLGGDTCNYTETRLRGHGLFQGTASPFPVPWGHWKTTNTVTMI